MTLSEKELWKLLRMVDGYTARRQVAVDDYVFDFGFYTPRLLIELDGGIHRLADVQAKDKAKELHAIASGFRVLRLTNDDVWGRPDWVLDQVRAALSARIKAARRPSPPNPLSARERGSEER